MKLTYLGKELDHTEIHHFHSLNKFGLTVTVKLLSTKTVKILSKLPLSFNNATTVLYKIDDNILSIERLKNNQNNVKVIEISDIEWVTIEVANKNKKSFNQFKPIKYV